MALLVQELEAGADREITRADLSSAVGALAKILVALYRQGTHAAFDPEYFSVTDAVIMIQYLMESHNINNFDLAMWVSRARAGLEDK
ncbi:hypothetical protein AWB85_19125 [Mycobacteroides immunogenum]|uniref:Uncharacterized protein n=1 Tax=Mycobacteroides immunogenum TaxID=83262 RepID=A0A179VF55_9MYCO|nr:hypothetical protein AWB85_19125 [Mycobacteroides immunogenum]